MTARSRASCRWTLTFHDCIDALRNPGSVVEGASPAGAAASTALTSEIVPVAVNGTPKGGLLAVSLTAVVPGSSTALAYPARRAVRPSPEICHATPTRGSKFRLFCRYISPMRDNVASDGVEHDEPVVALGGGDVPLVAHAELDRESVVDGDLVLEKQRPRRAGQSRSASRRA